MSLSFHFTLSAAANVTAEELVEFLKSVETDARKMGFRPTTVLDAGFDTPERREFARRLTTGQRRERGRRGALAACANFTPLTLSMALATSRI